MYYFQDSIDRRKTVEQMMQAACKQFILKLKNAGQSIDLGVVKLHEELGSYKKAIIKDLGEF